MSKPEFPDNVKCPQVLQARHTGLQEPLLDQVDSEFCVQKAGLARQPTIKKPSEDQVFIDDIDRLAKETHHVVNSAFKRKLLKGSPWPSLQVAAKQPCVNKLMSATLVEQITLHGEGVHDSHDEFWYSDDETEVRYTRPEDEEHWKYGRIVTLDYYITRLFWALVESSSFSSSIIALTSFQAALWAKFFTSSEEEGQSTPLDWHIVAMCTLAFAVSISAKVLVALFKARREFHTPGAEMTLDLHKTKSLRFLAMFTSIIFLDIPLFVRTAPVSFHVRKAAQPFSVAKLQDRRVWVLGFLCEEQYVFKNRPYNVTDHVLHLVQTALIMVQVITTTRNASGGALAIPIAMALVSAASHLAKFANMFQGLKNKRSYLKILQQRQKELQNWLDAANEETETYHHLKFELGVVGRCLREDFAL